MELTKFLPPGLQTRPRVAAGGNIPNGGSLAWLQVLGGFLVIFNAQGLIQSYGVFQAYYEAVLLTDRSPSSIAWIGSFQIFFLFSMSILVSPLMDRGGFRFCFNGGCFVMFIGILVTSWCRKFWELLLFQGICTGIGMGLAFGGGILVLQSYFSTHLGAAAGLTSAGGSIGGMVYPAIAEQLVFKIGFGNTLRVFAAVAFVTLFAATCMVCQRSDPGPDRPEMDWGMLKDVPFLLMTASFFLTFWGIYFGFYFIVAYAQTHLHLDNHASVILLILMNGTNLLGRLLPPILSDRLLGPLNTIIPCIWLTAIFLFVWIRATTHTAILIIAGFYGFFSGGVQGLYNPVIWRFSGIHPRTQGVRIAFVFLFISVAALTGTPIGGATIKHEHGGYLHAQLFAALTVLSGGCLMAAVRYSQAAWRIVRV